MRSLGFGLLLIFVFLVPWEEAALLEGGATVTPLFGAASFVLVIGAVFYERRSLKPPPLLGWFLVFIGLSAASLLWTVDPAATISRVEIMVQMLAMMWVVWELTDSEVRVRNLLQAHVFGCVVLVVLVLQSYVLGVPLEGSRYAPADFSLNGAATKMGIGIALALLLASGGRGRRFFWLYVAYVPVALFGVVLTGSRSGFFVASLALLGSLVTLGTIRPLHRFLLTVVMIGLFAGVFFGLSSQLGIQENVGRVTLGQETGTLLNMTGRTSIWSAAMEVFREHPLLGTGAGTFSKVTEDRLDVARAAHNLVVETAVELGVAGLVVVLFVLLSVLLPIMTGAKPMRSFFIVLYLAFLTMALVGNVSRSKEFWFGMIVVALGSVTASNAWAPFHQDSLPRVGSAWEGGPSASGSS